MINVRYSTYFYNLEIIEIILRINLVMILVGGQTKHTLIIS